MLSWKMLVFVALASSAIAQVPDAPKPQAYLQNGINRALVASETSARLLDFVSTAQFEHDPCGCIVERGHFFGTFSLAPISRSTPASFAYQMGMAATFSGVSRELWKESQKHHSRLLRLASRGVLLYDLRYEVEVPINNWRLIATNGKKGF